MKLSKNFSLDEFLVSQTAARNNIDMTPSAEVIDNLQMLCSACLQPLRDEAGPIFISSGFRPLELNTKIGGSKTSAHITGDAADLKVLRQTPLETARLIVEMELPYDQVILEFPPNGWVHLGVADILRGEELTAHKVDGKTRYALGIVERL